MFQLWQLGNLENVLVFMTVQFRRMFLHSQWLRVEALRNWPS